MLTLGSTSNVPGIFLPEVRRKPQRGRCLWLWMGPTGGCEVGSRTWNRVLYWCKVQVHGDIRTSASLSPVALRHLAPHLARMWRPHSSRQGVCGQHCFLRHRRSPPTSACHWHHPTRSLLTPQPARSLQAIPVLCSAPPLFPAARSIAVPQRAPGGGASACEVL